MDIFDVINDGNGEELTVIFFNFHSQHIKIGEIRKEIEEKNNRLQIRFSANYFTDNGNVSNIITGKFTTRTKAFSSIITEILDKYFPEDFALMLYKRIAEEQ